MAPQRLFPDQNPVGKRFMLGRPTAENPSKWITVAGVVADTRLYGLANLSRLEIYFPFRQLVSGA